MKKTLHLDALDLAATWVNGNRNEVARTLEDAGGLDGVAVALLILEHLNLQLPPGLGVDFRDAMIRRALGG
jgi:hypothetical protein